MPKIQRSNVPPDLLRHLLRRTREREITMEALQQILRWIESNPTVPTGDWYKRFQGVTRRGKVIGVFSTRGGGKWMAPDFEARAKADFGTRFSSIALVDKLADGGER